MQSDSGVPGRWPAFVTFTLLALVTLTCPGRASGQGALTAVRGTLYRRTRGVRLEQSGASQLCPPYGTCGWPKSLSCVMRCSTWENCTGVNFNPGQGSCVGVTSGIYSFGSSLVRDQTWDNFSPVQDPGGIKYVRDEQGWILVFRAQSQAFTSPPVTTTPGYVLSAWMNDSVRSEDQLPDLEDACYGGRNGSCSTGVYRSGLLSDWPFQAIDRVRVNLYTGGQLVKHLVFNGTGSNTTSWFHTSRLLNSSWTDLIPGDPNLIVFSDSANHVRALTVLKNYDESDCPASSWFMILDKYSNGCANEYVLFESVNTLVVPHFLYSPGATAADFTTAGGYQEAEVMAVFVKLL